MDEAQTVKDFNELISKYDELKKHNLKDLSSDQDLTIAIMNLVGIEEHLFFTGAKTGKDEYFDLIKTVRDMRKDLLHKIVVNPEGEVWCISKHLLAASYRLMEVGTKQLDMGKKEEARNFFTKSYNLYTLFWGLVMKVVPVDGLKKIDDQQLSKHDNKGNILIEKFRVLVQKVINCCIE